MRKVLVFVLAVLMTSGYLLAVCDGAEEYVRAISPSVGDFQDDLEQARTIPDNGGEPVAAVVMRNMQKHRKAFREINFPACATRFRGLTEDWMTYSIEVLIQFQNHNVKAAKRAAQQAKEAEQAAEEEARNMTSD